MSHTWMSLHSRFTMGMGQVVQMNELCHTRECTPSWSNRAYTHTYTHNYYIFTTYDKCLEHIRMCHVTRMNKPTPWSWDSYPTESLLRRLFCESFLWKSPTIWSFLSKKRHQMYTSQHQKQTNNNPRDLITWHDLEVLIQQSLFCSVSFVKKPHDASKRGTRQSQQQTNKPLQQHVSIFPFIRLWIYLSIYLSSEALICKHIS